MGNLAAWEVTAVTTGVSSSPAEFCHSCSPGVCRGFCHCCRRRGNAQFDILTRWGRLVVAGVPRVNVLASATNNLEGHVACKPGAHEPCDKDEHNHDHKAVDL